MILVIAGTSDGRDIALRLRQAGLPVLASVISEYGRELTAVEGIEVNMEPLDAAGLTNLIHARQIRALVDASHPYAAGVSQNCLAACRQTGLPYLRYERPAAAVPSYCRLYFAADSQQAAELAAGLGQTVFLTVGSRALPIFKQAPSLSGHRLIARVLPEADVLTQCRQLGFQPRDMIAMQGPFSHDLNVAMFREAGADVIVTKDSGTIGGTDTKFSAAMALNLPIVVIARPCLEYGRTVHSPEEAVDIIKEVCCHEI